MWGQSNISDKAHSPPVFAAELQTAPLQPLDLLANIAASPSAQLLRDPGPRHGGLLRDCQSYGRFHGAMPGPGLNSRSPIPNSSRALSMIRAAR